MSIVPNPNHGSGILRFSLNKSQWVRLNVYDSGGRQVARIANGHHAQGTSTMHWSGFDNFGSELSAGVYLLRMQAQDCIEERKMVLIR